MTTVGVCEDDPAIRRVIVKALQHSGYDTLVAHNGAEALRLFGADTGVSTIVMDIGLPDSDGRDVCQALQSHGQTAPVLFLTALDQQHERLAGFSAGADDYVTKPFDTAELLARVGVLTRRHHEQLAHRSSEDLVLDPMRHSVRTAQGEVLLTPTEFRILASITARRGEVVRRRAVVAAGWPDGAIVHENTLDSFLRRLRRKLETIGAGDRIETVRGVGFRLS